MTKSVRHHHWLVVFVIGLSLCGCGTHLDFDSQMVQEAWLSANRAKMRTDPDLMSDGNMTVAEYSRRGKGACVIFVDNESAPQTVTAAYVLPMTKDGTSWQVACYISVERKGSAFVTKTFERLVFEDAPDPSGELDDFLGSRGYSREKLSGEDVTRLF